MTLRVYTLIGILMLLAGLWPVALRRHFNSLQQGDHGAQTSDEAPQDPTSELQPNTGFSGNSQSENRDVGMVLIGIGLVLIITSLIQDFMAGVR